MKWSLLLGATALAALPAFAHVSDCAKQQGVAKARCDRHAEMYKKCGTLKGDAHYDCDRAFLLANPLQCTQWSGDDAARCGKEAAAAKTCEPNAGREFMRCVRKATGESPTGH